MPGLFSIGKPAKKLRSWSLMHMITNIWLKSSAGLFLHGSLFAKQGLQNIHLMFSTATCQVACIRGTRQAEPGSLIQAAHACKPLAHGTFSTPPWTSICR